MANSLPKIIHGVLYSKGLHFGHLSGLGRVVGTLIGGQADMVPFMGSQIHDHAMRLAGVAARNYYWNAELLVALQIAVDRWYGFDSDNIIGDSYNVEVEALGAKMIYSDHAMPTVDVSDPLIKTPADLDKIGPLDTSKGRIPMAVELGKLYLKYAPGPSAGGLFCSPWSLICQAMGYPKAVRAIMRDKAYGQALFEWAEERVLYPFMQAFTKNGVKSAAGPDAWAAFPNLTPELAEEWVVPSVKRFGQRCKKELGMTVYAGTAAGDYCEEDPSKFDKATLFKCLIVGTKTFPLKVAFSGMGRTQDWNMNWMQEFAIQQGEKGNKLPIMASLNGRFMRDSQPEKIVAKLREWIDIMARVGGLVVWIGNVPSDTPQINIHTAVKAVHTLGKYPIAADLSSVKIEPLAFKPFDEWLKGQPEEEAILKAREWKPENRKVFA